MMSSVLGRKLGEHEKDNANNHPDVAYKTVHQSKRQKLCGSFLLSPWFYIFTFGLITAMVVGIYIYSQSGVLKMDITKLEVSKCPACFGQSACPLFFRGDVRLANFYGGRPIHWDDIQTQGDLIPVSMATRVGEKSQRAVLRRLQFPAPPEAVDAAICRRGILDDDVPPNIPEDTKKLLKCVPHLSIWRWLPTSGPGTGASLSHTNLLPSQQADLNTSRQEGYGPLVRCATPRLLKRIQENFCERTSFQAPTNWLRFDELMLLFHLVVNPHAITTLAFPATSGWPLPRYIGACGRLHLETYVGEPLSSFIGAPLNQRLKILSSLLRLPERLRNDEENFVLYLGAFDLDVFAVDPFTYEVNILQSRHIISVDLLANYTDAIPFTVNKTAFQHALRVSSQLNGCHGNLPLNGDAGGPDPPCLSVEHVDALCSRRFSDHNYWAVCATVSLASGGNFLDGIPQEIINILKNCLVDAQMGARKAHIQAALEVIAMELNKNYR